MLHKGQLTEWRDEKGFGFITPSAGGDRVFAHIKSFTVRGQRPSGGESVTYDLRRDPKGRLQAVNIGLSDRPARRRSASRRGYGTVALAVAFLAFVGVSATAKRLPLAIVGIYVLVSAIAFFVYVWDKSAAKKGRWRTRERTFHVLSLLGGWPGALLAQRILRHKSRKRAFQVVFWGTVSVNCLVFAWVFMNPGILSR